MKRLIVTFLIVFGSCSRKDNLQPISRTDREIALQNIGDYVILVAFLDLQTSVNSFEHFSKSYFVEPTETQKLLQLQSEWGRAAKAWKLASLFTFNPLDESKLISSFFSSPDIAAIESTINNTQIVILNPI